LFVTPILESIMSLLIRLLVGPVFAFIFAALGFELGEMVWTDQVSPMGLGIVGDRIVLTISVTVLIMVAITILFVVLRWNDEKWIYKLKHFFMGEGRPMLRLMK